MKKLFLVLICCLFIAPNVIADCAKPDGVALGAKREVVEKLFTEKFGSIRKKDENETRWKISPDSFMSGIFHNGIFYGFLTMTLLPASQENGAKLVKARNDLMDLAIDEGFVFEKDVKREEGSIQSVGTQFLCPKQPRIKVTISLVRDYVKEVYAVEVFHYISNGDD